MQYNITITLNRYNELLRKEFVYELERAEHMEDSYISSRIKALYQLNDTKEEDNE